jgi:hypothetical protein
MKESYLHLIWKQKRMLTNDILLTDGRPIEILKTGFLNNDAGPDFFNGSVRINELIWNGNIEIHVKSSDWYKHGHQNDRAYDNVILHVVLEHDREVLIKGKILPTLELKDILDYNHYQKFEQLILSKTWIPCENSLTNVTAEYFYNQIENCVIDRFERKNIFIKEYYGNYNHDLKNTLYFLFAKAFGLKVNELPFIQLHLNLPLKVIWQNALETNLILTQGVAGFFQSESKYTLLKDKSKWQFLKHKYALSELNFYAWKFKGLRPVSFPHLKIKDFTSLINNQNYFSVEYLLNEDFETFFEELNFSDSFRNHLKINVLSPFLYFYGDLKNNFEAKSKAIEILMNSKPESNSTIKEWKKRGVKVKSSFDSQGLLELKNELCTNYACLKCKIGNAILNK